MQNDFSSFSTDVADDSILRPQMDHESQQSRLIRRLLEDMRDRIDQLERLIGQSSDQASVDMDGIVRRVRGSSGGEAYAPPSAYRVVDGVFDGEHMVGEDGKQYLVPPNYASKSKLVEGDMLRLTITDGGRFIFKQKGPNERQRMIGMLVYDEQTDHWFVAANGIKYRVLTASVTYYHGAAGDDAVILVPRETPSSWAAVENIIKHDETGGLVTEEEVVV
ncbi:hypothetical protein KBD34_05135 [Patescibacteria group bacterium]|nr:hypothetical protein [Patescibacteria group bacterium]